MTIPHIKSLSSSVRPFYCLWRLHGGVLNFIHMSATGEAEIAKYTYLKGCPHTFVYIVYVVEYACRHVGIHMGQTFKDT